MKHILTLNTRTLRLLIALVWILLTAIAANAQTVLADFENFDTNGTVQSIEYDEANEIIYIGGDFTHVGERYQYGAAVDGTTNVITDYPAVDGIVRVAYPDGAGGFFIGGDFTTVGTESRSNIAYINASGTVTSWNPSADGTVRTIFYDGSTVYAGGDFTNIGGQSRNNLAGIDPSTGLATTWDPDLNNRVRTITSDGTNIYVGGDFTLVGSDSRVRLADFDIATHSLGSWTPEANSSVYGMAINGSDIYIGGNFTEIDGTTRGKLASVTTSGSLNSWDPNAVGGVFALRIQGSYLYVGGSFNTISSTSRSKIASFDLSDGSLRTWNPGFSGIVNSITSSTGGLFVGSQSGFGVLNLTTGDEIAFDVGWTGGCNALAISGSNLYLGGFGKLGGEKRSGLAAIDATTGDLTSWAPDADGTVYDMVINGTEMIVGGDFDNIGGEARANLAAVSLSTGLASAWDLSPNGAVYSLLKSGDDLYFGGLFTQIGGVARKHLVRVDLVSGNLENWFISPDDRVNSIALSDHNTLYVGGNFEDIAGAYRPHMVELDITTGSLTSWTPNVNNEVHAVALNSNGDVYVGGRFTSAGGSSRSRFAVIDASTGLATSFDPSPNADVEHISFSGDITFIGGNFNSFLGETRRAFVAIASDGTLLDWQFDSGIGYDIYQDGLNVYIGGSSFTIDGVAYTGLTAVSRPNGSPLDISLSNNSIEENATSGTLIGTFTSDDDNGDTHSYTFVSGAGDDDNGNFSISGDELINRVVLDFETQKTHSIRVKSEDGNGNSLEKKFTISINNVLESENDILTFSIPEQTTAAEIDATDHTVTVIVPYETDRSSIVPTLTVNNSAAVSPLTGVAQNFNASVSYTVTAEDGTQQEWEVSVLAPIQAGTYTIGAGQEFTSLINLTSYLNTHGISGDVVFELTGNQHAGQATVFPFEDYPGTDLYSFTLRPASGITDIDLNTSIRLRGVENFNLEGEGEFNINGGVTIMNGVNDASKASKNITIMGSNMTSSLGVYVRSVDGLVIDGNIMRGVAVSGAQQIYRYSGVLIDNITEVSDVTIRNNDIFFGQEFNPSSIQSSVYGIRQGDPVTGYIKIYNNAIRLNPAQTKGGIYGIIASADDVEIYHNTVLLEGGDGSTLNAECVSATATNSVLIKNNILDVNVNQTGTSASISQLGIKLTDSSIPAVEMEDNNITFLNADRNYDGYFRVDLGIALDEDDLTTIESQFPGTTYSDVSFVDRDNGDYNLDGSSLEDFDLRGSFIVSVTTDIEGTSRNTSFASKGAFEAPFNFIVWNGTAWSNATGPSGGGDDVIIDGDYNMGTEGYFDSRDLTIKGGATMTIDGESSLVMQRNLINNGTLVVESGSSLLTYSPNTISGNDITFKRNTRYADGRYSFVGSPVEQDASIIGSDLGTSVYKYNESTAYGTDGINRWEDASADELVPGKGYTQAFQQEITFTGMPNQGTITIDGTFTDVADPDHEGWVLVSNPYPAPIDVADFLSANTSTTGTIYIWDDNGSDTQRGTNSDYIVANGTMATNTTPAGGQTRYDQIMGSMQGFFVKLNSAADVEIEFNESMRVTGNSDDHFFRETQLPIARINLTSNDGLFKQTVIGLAEDATEDELNRNYDAQAFNATSSDGLFTMKAGRSLSLNGMTNDWKIIQLQVNTATAGIYEISVELEEYGQALYLKDHLTGEVTDLRNHSYTFSAQAGVSTDRFELLSNPSEVLGLNNGKVMVYAHNSILHIQQEGDEVREYQLFNMNGQKLLSKSVQNKEEVNLSTYAKGIYLVFDGERTHKIILD